jgi:hypothetical protein
MIVAVKQLNQLLQEGRDLLDFLNEIEIMRYIGVASSFVTLQLPSPPRCIDCQLAATSEHRHLLRDLHPAPARLHWYAAAAAAAATLDFG